MIKPTENIKNAENTENMDNADNIEKVKQEENKTENRKALKVFIPTLIGAGLIGGVFGFLIVMFEEKGITLDLVSICKTATFYVSPWGVILSGLAGILLTCICYSKANRRYKEAVRQAKDGEIDEDEVAIIDLNLSDGMMILSIFMIIQCMFFGLVMVNLEKYIDLIHIWSMLIMVFFMVFTFTGVKLQQKIIDLEKVLNPEKSGSVYDVKFVKKWEESCDEMEKMLIYKSAYKSYRACNMACAVLWILFAMLGMALKTGVLPILAVTAIWLTLTITYMLEARKLEHKK